MSHGGKKKVKNLYALGGTEDEYREGLLALAVLEHCSICMLIREGLSASGSLNNVMFIQ